VTSNKLLIAIVDDDESGCRALEGLVRSLGMAAETYTSSEDFVNRIESLPSFRLDCVILDVQMPGMNGIEVQRRIRHIHKDIPVIFITAHDDHNARERALAGGAAAFLRKPCNDALIIRTLDAALGRRGSDEKAGGLDGGESK
jgi:FixJ family two-component response regulator